MDKNMKIGFIGFGNMAMAICDGLLLKKIISPENIYACARNQAKLSANASARGIHACADASEAAAKSDILVVAVTPDQARNALEPALPALTGKIIVSISAGCLFDFYEEFLPAGTAHISTIPNTPVSVGEGVFVCEERHSLSGEQKRCFEEIFGSIAVIEYVKPELLWIGGSVAGCAPAFAAMMIEALGDAGVKYGLSRQTAYRLASQMMAGTGKLALKSSEHPGALKDAVCSPGGDTIRGVIALDKNGFRGALDEAMDAVMREA